jgi:hypothetical protein
MVTAIDFTASNGNPKKPSSLHAMGQNNQYVEALIQVGTIIEPYDADRSFPVFGFGGVPRFAGQAGVSHCFPLNGNPSNPEIIGIEGIIGEYQMKISQIDLAGPTLFNPLLEQFLMYTREVVKVSSVYQVLLLLTDGAIHDMEPTKKTIVELSELPCSIIIVGVGSADFSAMEELDGDGGKLRDSRGRPCRRDVVQFVEYREAIKRGNLAEQVLKEVPGQVVTHMEAINFKPAYIQPAGY